MSVAPPEEYEVVVSRVVAATPDEVWAALTEPVLVQRWMGATVDSTWRPGATVTWSGEYQGQTFEDRGEILEVKPAVRLVHTHESGGGLRHELTWELLRRDAGTELVLRQRGATSAAQAEQFRATWAQMLGALGDVVESAH